MYYLTSNEWIYIYIYIYIYIKYFDNGGKNMSFMIKDHSVSIKYNEIWNKIKKTLSMRNFTACVFIMKNK